MCDIVKTQVAKLKIRKWFIIGENGGMNRATHVILYGNVIDAARSKAADTDMNGQSGIMNPKKAVKLKKNACVAEKSKNVKLTIIYGITGIIIVRNAKLFEFAQDVSKS
jgi:hypothetical protein